MSNLICLLKWWCDQLVWSICVINVTVETLKSLLLERAFQKWSADLRCSWSVWLRHKALMWGWSAEGIILDLLKCVAQDQNGFLCRVSWSWWLLRAQSSFFPSAPTKYNFKLRIAIYVVEHVCVFVHFIFHIISYSCPWAGQVVCGVCVCVCVCMWHVALLWTEMPTSKETD